MMKKLKYTDINLGVLFIMNNDDNNSNNKIIKENIVKVACFSFKNDNNNLSKKEHNINSLNGQEE